MSGFSADWLQRREPFDTAARDVGLARRFGAALGRGQNEPRRIVDLAAGSGANFRVLAPQLGGDQDWLLVDHDPALIAAQAATISRWAAQAGWTCRDGDGGGLHINAGTATWRVRAQALDLARDLEQLPLAEYDGVTTTAFLDLVSAAWLDRLCTLLTRGGRPLLATLTVDGRRVWQPPMPADARIQAAFQGHQSGDKGFGLALGSEATAYLADRLAAQGHAVSTSRSDWRIVAAHREMLLQMLQEAAAVAHEADPAGSALFTVWQAEREQQIEAGVLALDIGHLDLLALPKR